MMMTALSLSVGHFEKEESWDRIFEKESGNLANSYENETICIIIK